MMAVYSFSKCGHNSTPNGRSMVGEGKDIDFSISKDMIGIICAEAPAPSQQQNNYFEGCICYSTVFAFAVAGAIC